MTVSVFIAEKPYDIKYDAAGRLVFAEYDNGRVTRWDIGATQGETVAGHGTRPTGVAIDRDGSYIVADYKNNHVMKWAVGTSNATKGELVVGGGKNSFGQSVGAVITKLDSPYKVEVAANGDYVILERNRVSRWVPGASNGTVVCDKLNSPRGLAIDFQGNYVISEAGNDRVLRWAEGADTGEVVAQTGLRSPQAAVPMKDGYLIADTGNNRVVWWSAGATIGQTIAGGEYDEPLNQPRAVLPAKLP